MIQFSHIVRQSFHLFRKTFPVLFLLGLCVACKENKDIAPEQTEKSISPEVQRSTRSFEQVSLERLNLNRTAKKLTSSQRNKFKHSHTGFIWNSGDNATVHWRPQGIAGISRSNRKWLAVSWYGRKRDSDNPTNYENRGVRISFVDVTSMDNIKYRHVLLVDENHNTFKGMHAGGLVYKNGELHVPDSRSSTSVNGFYKIHVFSINSIQEVPSPSNFYNYRYIMVKTRDYLVPKKPSFLSYDWTRNKLVTGTWKKGDDPQQRISWGTSTSDFYSSNTKYHDLQGAGSENGTAWISQSFGRNKKSKLLIRRIKFESGRYRLSGDRKVKYPPGLEDIHVSKTSDNIWLLTEFGPKEKGSADRIVFAVKKWRIKP